MKIEDKFTIDTPMAARRYTYEKAGALRGIPYEEIKTLLQGNGVGKHRSHVEIEWDGETVAHVPPQTVLGTAKYAVTRAYVFRNEKHYEPYEIRFAIDGSNGIIGTFVYDGDRERAMQLWNCFRMTATTLEDRLRAEKEEERRQEKERMRGLGYAHPDDFGGSDF